MPETPKYSCARVPCGSCPYRRNVPSGIWERHEYDKLPDYDAPTWAQPTSLFMCHQNDGKLCAGWVACHGAELLALRLAAARGTLDPSVFAYETEVAVFRSGAEALAHGIRDIPEPGKKASKMIAGIIRKRAAA